MPGHVSEQYSDEVTTPLESTSVAHQGPIGAEVQTSCCLPLWMKGNIQLQFGEVVVVVDVESVVCWPSPQTADSSPTAAKANLFLVMTAALLESPATPVGVPVIG